jgi:hypothetical protein
MATVRLFIAILFLAHTTLTFSQDTQLPNPSGATQKPNAALNNSIERFKNTEFMLRFNDLKRQVEGDAEDFVAQRSRFSGQDVRKVQSAYERTAVKFNQVLLDIKQDFMDKEKIKMINKFPQMYSDGLANKINDLERVYRENLQLALSQVTDNSGSAILAVLLELIKASTELSAYFKGIKYEKQAMSEEYVNQHLIQPNRMASWRELIDRAAANGNSGNVGNNGGGGRNDNGNNGNNNDNGNNGNNNDNGNNGGSGNNDNGNGNNGNGNDNGNSGNNENPTNNSGNVRKTPRKNTGDVEHTQTDKTNAVELDQDSSVIQQQDLRIKKQPTQKPTQQPAPKKNNW